MINGWRGDQGSDQVPAENFIIYEFALGHCLFQLLPDVGVVWLLVEEYVTDVFQDAEDLGRQF